MTTDLYDDMGLERTAKELFEMAFDIDKVIVRDADVGKAAKATVLLTKKKQLLCYIHGPAKLQLADVKKIAARMGLKVELYMPPKGQPNYFDDIGAQRFRDVFPGHSQPTNDDLIYYRTLAPYSPALLHISEIKDGMIYQADSDARSGWRPATKFSYRRIKTS